MGRSWKLWTRLTVGNVAVNSETGPSGIKFSDAVNPLLRLSWPVWLVTLRTWCSADPLAGVRTSIGLLRARKAAKN